MARHSIAISVVTISLIYALGIYCLAPAAPWLALYQQYSGPIISMAWVWFLLSLMMSLCRFAYLSRGVGSPTRYMLSLLAAVSVRSVGARIWPIAVLIILMPAFNVFKQALLPMAGFQFDAVFAGFDELIVGTQAPGLWLVKYFNSPMLSRVIDSLYHAWFFPMVLGVMVVAFSRDAHWRQRYMMTFALAWFVMGTLMAFALPAAGPFYVQSVPAFAEQHALLLAHQAFGGELQALTFQAYLRAAEANGGVVMGGGISAMPSMHNAFALLFALACWSWSRCLSALLACYAAAVLFGSVYLGWHYLIDGLIAWLSIAALWHWSGRLVR